MFGMRMSMMLNPVIERAEANRIDGRRRHAGREGQQLRPAGALFRRLASPVRHMSAFGKKPARIGQCIKAPLVVLLLASMLVGRLAAQTCTILNNFSNQDESNPQFGLVLSGETLYGTSGGTIFKVNTSGAGFTVLYDFIAAGENFGRLAELALSGNMLYGTTHNGGAWSGTVFALSTAGDGFRTLYSFSVPGLNATNPDGCNPLGGVILSGNALYGTCYGGGNSGHGTVFKVNTDGTGFRTLHHFTGGSDGATPYAGLALSGGTVYGVTYFGGANYGTVFKLNTDGTGFSTLHTFMSGSDGAYPGAPLIVFGNVLYGTASGGGSSNDGTVFKLNTDGTDFTVLHDFDRNTEGAEPDSALVLSDDILYGATSSGGSDDNGTVFRLRTDGTGFATLHRFSGSDGSTPNDGLVLSGNTLYGMAKGGGTSDLGTIFRISLPVNPPSLSILRLQASIVLSWATNETSFTLQSTTNLVAPATWTPVSGTPTVINGLNAVTNAISATARFYRLSQ